MAQCRFCSGKHIGLFLGIYNYFDSTFLIRIIITNRNCKFVLTYYFIGCYRNNERTIRNVMSDVSYG